MTTGYVINIGTASAKQWAQFSYEKTLNSISTATIALDGVNSVYAAQFDVDKEIYIYKNGTLKFRGKVVDQTTLSGGGIVLPCIGIEIELTDEKAPMVAATDTTRVWLATSDNTILSTLVTSISGWTVDVSNSTAITVSSFRVTASESVWNCVIRLIEQTGKDISVDQTNKKIYMYDKLTRADKFIFIDGKNAENIVKTKSRSKAGKVLVYGKGDGEFQIRGSYGAGTPVELIIDRNVLTTAEANARAEVEYDKLNPERKKYNFTPILGVNDLLIGDAGTLINNSARINDAVEIVRLKTSVNGIGSEKYDMEVTNSAFRIASKNAAEEAVKNRANNLQSQSSMQGSGNAQSWQRGMNAKVGNSLKLPFYLSTNQIVDEAGNIRVDSLTIDYDIDPFRSDVGTASADSHDHALEPGATDSHGHTPSDSGHTHGSGNQTSVNTTIISDEGEDYDTTYSASTGWNNDALTETYNGSFSFLLIKVIVIPSFSNGDFDVGIRLHTTGGVYHVNRIVMHADTTITDKVIRETFLFPRFATESTSIKLDLYSSVANDYGVYMDVWGLSETHSHTISTFDTNSDNAAVTDTSMAPGLSGDSDTATAGVTIGDDVSDAGSINATDTALYLDFWSGAAWVNKHTIASTSATLGEDVDMTNSGTYPDAIGWWRIRVEPNNATADYVQGIVKVKHELDN